MPPPAPTLLSTRYDGNVTVSAQWQPVDGYSEYTIAVFAGTTVVKAQAAFGIAGSVKLDAKLDPAVLYQVAVAAGSGSEAGPYGNRLVVVTAAVGGLTAAYDGTQVSARWSIPAGQYVTGAQLTLTDATAPAVVAQQSFTGESGTLALPAPLDPSHAYTLAASGTYGTSTGPAASPALTLVVAAAAAMQVQYDPAARSVQVVLAPPVPDGCDPAAALLANGVEVLRAGGAGTLVTLPLGATLDPAVAYEVLPFWTSGGATGPSAAPVEVLVSAPTVRAAAFSGTEVSARWENLAGPPYPTGGLVIVSAAGEPNRQASFYGADEGTFAPDPPLGPAAAYRVQVAARRGPAIGPASAPMPLVVGTRDPTSASYDGRVLTAGWADGAVAGATGYRMVVLRDGAVVAQGGASPAGGALEVALDPGGAYAVGVHADGPGGAGPLGATPALVTALPGVGAVAWAADAVTVTVTPPHSTAGIGRYQAVLLQGGREVASSAPVAAGDAPRAVIPASTGGGTGYAVAVRGLGPTGGAAATGPLGTAVPIAGAAPRLEGAVLDGSVLRVSWTLPDEPPGTIQSSTLTLAPETGDPVSFPAQTGSSASLDVAGVTFDPTLTYRLTAACNGPAGQGPASVALAVIPSTPAVTAAAYDGARVAAAWAWAEGASGAETATGYRLVLRKDTLVAASAVVVGGEGALPLPAPLDPGGSYTLSVDPLAPGSETTAAAGVGLLPAAPRLESAAATAESVVLTWVPPTAPDDVLTGYDAVFSTPGAADQRVALAAPVSPATVPLPALPADPGAAVTVALVPTGAAVRGPASNALPLLRGGPGGLAAVAEAGLVTLSWTGAPPPADAYAVVLTKDGGAVTSVLVPGSGAAVPVPAEPSGAAYAAMVTPRAGSASGPGAGPLALVLFAPAVASPAFDGRTASATVTAPAAGAATLTGYDAVVLRNGVPAQRATLPLPGEDGVVSLPLTLPVDAGASYALELRARAGLSVGAPATAALLVASPVVSSVVAAGDATALTVTVRAGGVTGTAVQLQARLYADGVAGEPQDVGGDGTVTLPLPEGSAFTVAARAIADGATGPWSAPVAAVTAAPAGLSARYAAGRLTAAWSGAAGDRFLAGVSTGGAVVVQALVAGNAADLPLEAAAGAAYALAVARVEGVAQGPAATLPLVTDGCDVQTATAGADRSVTVAWAGPAVPEVIPGVSWPGGETELPRQTAARPLAVTLPAWVPNGAALSLRGVSGAATGPAGTAAPLLTTAPAGLAVAFADGKVGAAWSAAAGAEVDGYWVTLRVQGAEPVAVRVSGLTATLDYEPADGKAANVTGAAASGGGRGPDSAAVPVIAAAPALTAAAYDGTAAALSLTPAADAAATATLVSLLAGGVAARQVTLGGTGGTVDVPPGAWTVRVQGIGASTTGPPGTDIALVTGTPAPGSATFDPLGGGCTFRWPVVPGAPAYAMRLTNGAAVVLEDTVTPAQGASEASWVVAASHFAAEGRFAFSARAQDAASAPVATGPWCAPVPVLAAAPADVRVAYDGANARVGWTPVGSPLVTGYAVLAVTGRTSTEIGRTRDAGGTFALRADPANPPSIVVQALSGPSSGAPSATADVLAQGLFLSTGDGVTPSIAPRTAPASAATDLVLYLPQLFTTPPAAGDLPAAPPFVLAEAAAPFAYTLTIPHDSTAWTFTSEARGAVRTAYGALLTWLRTHTGTPAGIRTVQEAISRAMPQTFAETLYYAYGLTPADGWVDLRPGMVLRAEYEAYQSPGNVTDSAFLAGFVATATAEYEVATYLAGGNWLTGLDAFLATLAAAGGITVPATTADSAGRAQGGGGLVDTFSGTFLQPFYRLVYPPDVLAQNTTGSAYPYRNAVLLAGASLDALDAATANVRAGRAPGSGVYFVYFRGRTTLTACIRVEVNGAPRTVPLGTTVGNVLAGAAARPPSAGLPLQDVRLTRPHGAAVLSAGEGAGYPVGSGWSVRLDWTPGGSYGTSGGDWLDLPLLHGDALSFGAP